ncbi:hypothetical protein KR018_009342 [Drosophila ironensis]|nr:hypothetical protein KR018_009342 [Drosophila ironensis]
MHNNRPPMRGQSRVCILWLVLCKSVRFHVLNLFSIFLVIVGPSLVFVVYSATTALRNRNPPVAPALNLTTDVPSIYYSPKNRIVDAVIQDVVAAVGATVSKGFHNANSMATALTAENAFVGIEFEPSFKDIAALPEQVTVALRFPTHLRSMPKQVWKTDEMYSDIFSTADCYLNEGFLYVQSMLSRALIRAKGSKKAVPEVFIKEYPEAKENLEYSRIRLGLSGFVVLPFTLSAAYLAQTIVRDKQSHRRAMLELMGVNAWMHWLSWFIVSYAMLSIPACILAMLQRWRFFPNIGLGLVIGFYLVYVLEVLWSAAMISTFFTDGTYVLVAILALHLASWLPWRLLLKSYQSSLCRSIFCCLFLYSSLTVGYRQLNELEEFHQHPQWDDFFAIGHITDHHYSLGIVVIFMLMGTVIRILICMYVDAVKGMRRREWKFFLRRSFWCGGKDALNNVESQAESQSQHVPPTGNPIIIRTHNLGKKYNNVRVVDDISLTFHQDEITVFMGHNDSGKTTILKMIAGLVLPSRGYVTINGLDVVTEWRQVRQYISICLQNEVLFDKNDVRWNLTFYSRLRGLNCSEASAEVDKYLDAANLQEFADESVLGLPSGIKRLVSLCCCLCGQPRNVLLLDEPCTSLDPVSRRRIWDLLRRERMGRCILITTHNMHEAEVLADRMVILCDGRVMGYGTPGFLNAIADSGSSFVLTITMMRDCLVSEVTHFLQTRLPGIRLQTEYSVYICYELPTMYIGKFSEVFDALEESMDKLGIKEFRVAAPTLGKVFLRIGAEQQQANELHLQVTRMMNRFPLVSLLNLLPTFEIREDNPIQRGKNQWRAIWFKKWSFTRCYGKLYMMLMLYPSVSFLMILSCHLLTYIWHGASPSLLVNGLTQYPNPILVIQSNGNNDFSRIYTENAQKLGATVIDIGDKDILKFIRDHSKLDASKVQRSYVAGVSLASNSLKATGWKNTNLEHGSGLALGLVYQTLGMLLAQLNLQVVNNPRKSHIREVVQTLNTCIALEFSSVALVYLLLATSTFAVMPVLERKTDLMHLQLINGVSRVNYWLAHMAWDMSLYMLMVITLVVFVGLPTGTAGRLMVLLTAFGFSAIAFTYLLCFFSKNMGNVFSIVMYINMLGMLSLFIHPKNDVPEFWFVESLLLFLPHYALFSGQQNMLGYDVARKNEHSLSIRPYFNPKMVVKSVADNHDVLVYLIFTGVVYLLLVIYSWVPRRIGYLLQSLRGTPQDPDPAYEDEEVTRVRLRVAFRSHKHYWTHPLIMKNVFKNYGDVVAVRCLTLDLNPFECLCLLGRNGAGKSSTFNMITGKVPISAGHIYIKGYCIKQKPLRAIRHIGFCPKEPALANYLTGREMLWFCCLINGLRRNLIKKIVYAMEDAFMLTHCLDVPISVVSKGTKRKLMLAMASLDSTIICLDEPTSGVDLNAKYDIWYVLEALRLGGMAILLTTHSMEEAEILASSVGILEYGSLLCYGTLGRLRTRFDKNIYVKIKVGLQEEMENALVELQNYVAARSSSRHSNAPGTIESLRASVEVNLLPYVLGSEADVRSIYEDLLIKVEETFLADHPYSTVSERIPYRGIITFCIPQEKIKYSNMFRYMEGIKKDLLVLYYTIGQTTLEDVFVSFLKSQEEDPLESS